MSVMLAQGLTGRDHILKVGGGWHGSSPYLLKGVKFHPGEGFEGRESAGLLDEIVRRTLVTRFNDCDDLRRIIAERGDKIACFIVEPFLIARLNPDGSLDLTFDPSTGLGIGSGDQWAVREILLLPDGRVLIAGSFDRYDGTPCPSLARLLPDGSLDRTLSASLSWSSRSPWLTAMVLQPDGKIVVGGLLDRANGLPVESIVRLNPDGSTDPAFRQGLGNNSGVRGLALQPDGKLRAAWSYFEKGQERGWQHFEHVRKP